MVLQTYPLLHNPSDLWLHPEGVFAGNGCKSFHPAELLVNAQKIRKTNRKFTFEEMGIVEVITKTNQEFRMYQSSKQTPRAKPEICNRVTFSDMIQF